MVSWGVKKKTADSLNKSTFFNCANQPAEKFFFQKKKKNILAALKRLKDQLQKEHVDCYVLQLSFHFHKRDRVA